ncbi:DUF5686 and carboxypeptidase regulatory-like domain-containing protein [Sediminibacterium sp.]|uniref:DUF5686 and carboxypeptidase regulatory-like domain-containing protein n=1 Tax=Sediminibacterium sp. TaxID=1917865 RepID=UPI003F712129
MLRFWVIFLFILFSQLDGLATEISGTIKSVTNNEPLPFSSVLVKGSTKGASANSSGFYSITLSPGTYVLVFQYIGYQTVEHKITVSSTPQKLDITLVRRDYQLNEVIVKTGGEDPAYSIIRNAIAKRALHLKEIKKYTTEVYIKGQLQLRNYPKTFMGQKVDFEDGDSSKRKMLLLSETIAKYSVNEPDQRKVEVISTKVSGRSDGFGFSNPQIISFYDNIISLGNGLNPRGFISPIADNALNFYKYKFEGTFYEFGKEISRIKVIPKRAYEPLFTGYIHITENDWHVQSVDLKLLRKQQMQLLDTLTIQQQYIPLEKYWVIKQQVIYPSGKFFGFDFFGSFLQVYDQFNIAPNFKPKYFNNTVLKFNDSSNKKTMAYWDSIRPLPLLLEEIKDYKKKDSLEKVRESPAYLDSLDKIRNKFTLSNLLLTGKFFSKRKTKTSFNIEPLINTINFNTVEGGVINLAPQWRKQMEGRKSLSITPELRYGFANKHFNPSLTVNYTFGKKYIQSFNFSGGKKVFQFNNAAPISEFINSYYTLMREQNFLKIYEADFLRLNYNAGIGNGLNFSGVVQYQDRRPLTNLPDVAFWKDIPNRTITSNHPAEFGTIPMQRHQAFIISAGFSWLPGAKYVEYPDRKVNIGSGYPTFNLSVTKAFAGILGSDANYTKWRLSISDDLDLKLAGELNYAFTAGGFLQKDKVFEPDQVHFLGNQVLLASAFTRSFQLAPYYKFSNTASLYGTGHIEYHLNGLLTNKIPGFKKLNWFIVTGANALLLEKGKYYVEYFLGLENIFKVIRVDFIRSIEKGGAANSGIRLALPFGQ